MRVYDTHLHLFYPDTFTYPWCMGLPALSRAFHYEDYVADLRAAQSDVTVTHAVFMEADVPETQQEDEAFFFCQKTGEDELPLTTVIASCRPESNIFAAQIEKLAANKRIRGVRRILHTSDDSLSQSSRFINNVNLLASLDLTFDLCLRADQLDLGMTLADNCPTVQFILDHCGIPAVGTQDLDPWRGKLRSLAERPNVACKISGIAAYANVSLPLVPQLRPFVEHSISVFGWDRVMWGSDWPVCNLTFGLSEWLAATSELFANVSECERENLGMKNARRLYRI